jgi:hypothetical protein
MTGPGRDVRENPRRIPATARKKRPPSDVSRGRRHVHVEPLRHQDSATAVMHATNALGYRQDRGVLQYRGVRGRIGAGTGRNPPNLVPAGTGHRSDLVLQAPLQTRAAFPPSIAVLPADRSRQCGPADPTAFEARPARAKHRFSITKGCSPTRNSRSKKRSSSRIPTITHRPAPPCGWALHWVPRRDPSVRPLAACRPAPPAASGPPRSR